MRDKIVSYLQQRKIPLKTRHLARKFEIDIIELMPILNMLAQQHIIKYKKADRKDRIDWAGWILA